ncbi:thioredoxin reductase [Weizmannia acidilactici]|uniref:Thioredoxin reductase n=1 Tax=Weizmannia acidilactici TaxID=2607726 RepID=A0A5J4JKS4_9BACI|nr:NAD(P)/FAD-dependent oxidoreductase [Weizmannia acidilactici]GER68114.1 thioredoxin reductase [Weizmannia acidilactici]GER70957.1 thioredoxin reductase [Weizmannia acidilactici]
MQDVDVLIIGGGPAGISAAIWCKRLGINHLLVEEKEALGGQLSMIHNRIIDYPGLIARDGEEMRKIFLKHVHTLQCRYKLNTRVLEIDGRRYATVETRGQKEAIRFRYLIFAAGAIQKRLGIPGEKEMLARGENYSATRDSCLFKGKTVAVAGGGDRAFEGAILLAEAGARVYLINRSGRFKARSGYITRAKACENIHLLIETRVTEIAGEDKVEAVELVNQSGDVSYLPVSAVFIRIGTKPNSALVKELVETDENGYIVSGPSGNTSCEWLYAIGDNCLGPHYSSIAGAAGQGAAAAKHIASLLTGHIVH